MGRRGSVAAIATLLAAATTWAFARDAHADKPACFPERTLARDTVFQDDAGRNIGAATRGTVVHVADENPADRGSWARVVFQRPFPISARVPQDLLEVYAKRDIEAVPDLAWWAGGAPIRIHAGRPGEARVSSFSWSDGSDALWAPPFGPSWARCEDLVGSSNHDRGTDCCSEAWVPTGPDRGGKRVKVRGDDERPVRFETERGDVSIVLQARDLMRIRRRGGRSLVWMSDEGGVVVQGWTAERLLPNRGGIMGGTTGCVIDAFGEFRHKNTTPAGLLSETPFSAEIGGAIAGRFPAGSRIELVERKGDRARVQFRRLIDGAPTFVVEGWVPMAALTITE